MPNLKSKVCVVRFRLGEILDERQLTQAEAARLTGLSPQAVIKLVHGPQAVQLETLGKLCSGLELSPEDLFVVEGG